MTIGALSFFSPWLLTGLVALPIIYWLLRTVPPRPQQITFPPTRILVGLENREKTPDKTPWWLMLIRLLAAALIIFALAEPILNPNRTANFSGSGPVVVVVDNGWSSGASWAERIRMAERVIDQAERQNRSVVVLATAENERGPLSIEAPNDARTRAAGLLPRPYAPDREAALTSLKGLLANSGGASVVWLSDGVDHGKAEAFATGLAELPAAQFMVVEVGQGASPLGLAARIGEGGRLRINLVRPFGAARQGNILALSSRGEALSEAQFQLAPGETRKLLDIELPLELRNQVSRVAVVSERSAGAVHLLDAGAKWSRVAIFSGTERDRDQPLLGPLYYVRKAMAPFSEVVEHQTSNLADGVERMLKRRPSMMILTDVGSIPEGTAENLRKWVQAGGVLVRFAGPRLEKGGDDLLPVELRAGGRTLGGALSWSTPQPLAPFSDDSLFAGLASSKEVVVRRQVLADPAKLGQEIAVWARLKDGTPLVTAASRDDGHVVLFHVTANSAWSDLPLSGLFVEMLRRVSTLGALSRGSAGEKTATTGNPSVAPSQAVLAPVQVLDGFGQLIPPPPTASPIARKDFSKMTARVEHPPGFYGPAGRPQALNILGPETELKPLPSLPASFSRLAYEDEALTDLKPWLFAAALALLLIDVIAVLLLQSGGVRRAARGTAAALPFAVILSAGLLLMTEPLVAQQNSSQSKAATSNIDPERARLATSRVTFGYVLTGDAGIDGTSQAGLSGLGRVLNARTAVEPREPIGVSIDKDEIAFFPMLYWPVLASQKELGAKVVAKVDAYIKHGGMIIFDTRDYGQGMPIGFIQQGSLTGKTPLQRLLGKLDLPRIEPVPQGHVLGKSFYLLDEFPGRWSGGQLWVEAGGGDTITENKRARQADGVSSVLITANDFVSAWALDERNLPLFPVVPGGERQREFAFRTGVNIVMYALTGNYKADQVHIPALLERLGQ